MADYKAYLAVHVINEEKIMKVTNNAAKRMLYDFHSNQNKRKPNSVHACYIIDGFLKREPQPAVDGKEDDGEDVHMQSSPFISSSMPQNDAEVANIQTRTIMLVKEEHMQEVQVKYEQIFSVHIYSLSPFTVQNLEILSDCNRAITKRFITEDPLIFGKKYGVIQNKSVKRRKGGCAPEPVPAFPVSKRASTLENSKSESDSRPTSSKGNPEAISPPASQSGKEKSKALEISKPFSRNAKLGAAKPPAIKHEKSDIMKAFSKPKPRPKADDTASSVDSGAEQPPKDSRAQADEPMKDISSESEHEDDFISSKEKTDAGRKSHVERAEQLRKMMDEDDEEMDDAPPDSADESPKPVAEEDELEQPAAKSAEPSPEPLMTVSGGRRRVTKEEPAWESFSEDEPPPTKDKTLSSSAASAKAKKAAGKPGQGNIMSFFGKK
ncbi:uncharacterized protein KY384_007617 [Bacidia gigantensis]|uniref:uncharacterized protein n=1 Tax=Bacidia gigantensis TaxID=2732470 RepID=UPI001D050E54|nr:uncharacterized protein KY384_007617 [Bacidia gigantensis]KAG8527465.1 hypothetical protein KY384_007617 [Bacidia gigantensis]